MSPATWLKLTDLEDEIEGELEGEVVGAELSTADGRTCGPSVLRLYQYRSAERRGVGCHAHAAVAERAAGRADAIGAGARHKGGSASLVLDAKALENLEVFENSSDRTATGTLFSIIDKCSSSFGRRALRAWLCAPPRRVEDILERQQAVGALLESAELRAKLAKTLKKLPDLERLLARVHAFSVTQTSNDATHYTDINRARLAELI
jgi:hypothetical protein